MSFLIYLPLFIHLIKLGSHILVVAPLSANTLAKMVHGISDNLLTSVIRAWDTDGSIDLPDSGGPKRVKRIVVAPAMNSCMWLNPVTSKQIQVLEEEWGASREFINKGKRKGEGWIEVLRPMEKELACGDTGIGGMREWKEIVKVIRGRLWLGEG